MTHVIGPRQVSPVVDEARELNQAVYRSHIARSGRCMDCSRLSWARGPHEPVSQLFHVVIGGLLTADDASATSQWTDGICMRRGLLKRHPRQRCHRTSVVRSKIALCVRQRQLNPMWRCWRHGNWRFSASVRGGLVRPRNRPLTMYII